MAILLPMADPVDLDELARRYLDLWEDQISALAADEQFQEAMGRVMSAAGGSAGSGPLEGNPWAAAGGLWPAMLAGMMAPGLPSAGRPKVQKDHDEAGGRGEGGKKRRPPTAGTEALGAAPESGGLDLGQLARRLAALEERIAALEPGTGRGRGGAKRKPRKG